MDHKNGELCYNTTTLAAPVRGIIERRYLLENLELLWPVSDRATGRGSVGDRPQQGHSELAHIFAGSRDA